MKVLVTEIRNDAESANNFEIIGKF